MNSSCESDLLQEMRRHVYINGAAGPNGCMTCGHCVSKCFLIDGYPEMNPRKLIRQVASGHIEEAADSEFIWACTLCGRCTTECPKDLRMDVIIRGLRRSAGLRGHAPHRITEGVKQALAVGNNAGIQQDAFIDMMEWLAEEAEEEVEGVEEGDLAIEFDKEGAEILYIPNPREYTSNPQMFQTYLKFFHYTESDWTLSSNYYDITNWAYYLGDHEATIKLVENLVSETEKLGCKILLSTECGHGFKILRHDAPKWLGRPLGFKVMSIVELAHEYFKSDRLPIKKDSIEEIVTYHDPCNVGRKLGIYDPPRDLLRHMAGEFVEMTPNRKYNLCCGGGGSVGQNTDMGKKRLEHAMRKRDQIIATGAGILATCCQNCLSQLSDLKDRYEMPLEVKSVIELVVESIES